MSPVSVPAVSKQAELPSLVERAGGAACFAWDEFFYAEHHNAHTQKAYLRAVKRFLAWAEGQGVELPAITPGMIGQYLDGLGGSPAKRNLHLSALRGFLDRLVNRHVVVPNPAASVRDGNGDEGPKRGRDGNGDAASSSASAILAASPFPSEVNTAGSCARTA